MPFSVVSPISDNMGFDEMLGAEVGGWKENTVSRQSKISMASNTTCGGDIGEETQTNAINETKTIKEKLGCSSARKFRVELTKYSG
jgi:hypothetical protein